MQWWGLKERRMGAVRIRHRIRDFATQPVIFWIPLGGKPKWLPLNFGFNDVMRTAPIGHIMVNMQGNGSPEKFIRRKQWKTSWRKYRCWGLKLSVRFKVLDRFLDEYNTELYVLQHETTLITYSFMILSVQGHWCTATLLFLWAFCFRYIRVLGTFNSANHSFHVVTMEAVYSSCSAELKDSFLGEWPHSDTEREREKRERERERERWSKREGEGRERGAVANRLY